MRFSGIGHYFQRVYNSVSIFGTKYAENVSVCRGKVVSYGGKFFDEFPAVVEETDRNILEEERRDIRVVRKVLRIEHRFLCHCPDSMEFLIDDRLYKQDAPPSLERGWWSISVVYEKYLSENRVQFR